MASTFSSLKKLGRIKTVTCEKRLQKACTLKKAPALCRCAPFTALKRKDPGCQLKINLQTFKRLQHGNIAKHTELFPLIGEKPANDDAGANYFSTG